MATVVKTTFKLKRGTAAKWKELNLVLAAGEPGFEIDTNSLKIGNGYTPWNELPYLATGGGSGEGGSIIVDTILSETSLNPIANKAVTEALKKLEQENYSFGEGFIVEEGPDGVQNISIDLASLPGVDTSEFITAEQLEAAIPTKVSQLDNDAGYLTEHQDLSDYALKIDIPSIGHLATKSEVEEVVKYDKASNLKRRFEVIAPEGVFVDYRDNEIRINTQRAKPVQQQPGPTGSSNQYYIQFRAYAPEGTTHFRETETGVFDDTIYDFTGSFAGTDEFGRNYSLAWMSIANFDGTNWNIYGDRSTVDKYLGFLYQYEWRNGDSVIGLDSIRIILTNDACHNDLVPDTTARRIDAKIAEVNTTLEQNYITIDQGVTKEELTTEVRTVIDAEVEQIIDDKIAAGVAVDAIDYGSF